MGDVTEQPMEAGGGEEVMPDLAQLVELALEVQTAKVKQLEAAKKQQLSASTSTAGSGGSGGGLPQVHKKYNGEPDHTILQDWISSVRQFLSLHRVPEHQHVVTAAGFLDESALQWWRHREGRHREPWFPGVKDFAHFADLLYVQFIVHTQPVPGLVQVWRSRMLSSCCRKVQKFKTKPATSCKNDLATTSRAQRTSAGKARHAQTRSSCCISDRISFGLTSQGWSSPVMERQQARRCRSGYQPAVPTCRCPRCPREV